MINKICNCGNVVITKSFYCKPCASKISKRYKDNNPEKVRESDRKFRINNLDVLRWYSQKYRINNKVLLRKYKQEYYIKYGEDIKKSSALKDNIIYEKTLSTATNHRQQWTTHDHDLALAKDEDNVYLYTAKEVAVMIGRTYYSVKSVRGNPQHRHYSLQPIQLSHTLIKRIK